jgi:hypothetical protein
MDTMKTSAILHIFVAALFGSCAANHNAPADVVMNAIQEIGRKHEGYTITREIEIISQYASDYPLTDDCSPVPVEAIITNPSLGYKWKTFFVPSEIYRSANFRAVSISYRKSGGKYVYGGNLVKFK